MTLSEELNNYYAFFLCHISLFPLSFHPFWLPLHPMIICYSSTGNTRLVANRVARLLGERVVFLSSPQLSLDSLELAQGESLGLFFPVHGWNVPRPVAEWIEHVKVADIDCRYLYAVVTCGDEVGMTIQCLDKLLLRHWGRRLDSCHDVVMPETYVALPYMYTDTQENAEAKLKAAQTQAEVIAERVGSKAKGCFVEHPGSMPWVLTYIIGAAFHKWLVTDRHFKVDARRCVRCGRCVSACNRGNMSGGKGMLPSWLHLPKRCTTCLACYHHCPQHAISFGPLTNRRGQYVAPSVFDINK